MRLTTTALAALAVAGASCKCGDSGLGPLTDTKPPSLGATGLLVEQPKDGETLSGQWVAVTGWFDPALFDTVLVTGGTSSDLYAPTGHVGVVTAPMTVRKDGRFIAARVPLDEGATPIQVLGVKAGVVTAITTVNVSGANTASAPITVVADPPFGNGPLSVKLSAFTGMGAAGWQWDFEGDGTFDSEEATPTHSYPAGRYAPLARTKVDNRWVYGTAPLPVSVPGTVSHTNTTVGAPRAIAVTATAVLVADGDTVRVFSPTLEAGVTLTGLSAPSGVAGDALGRVYVSDTGHDAVKRFTAAGALDVTFADGGVLSGVSKPGSLDLEPRAQELEDGGVETSWGIDVLDGDGALVSFDTADLSSVYRVAAPFGIDPDEGLTPKDFVHPAGALEGWFSAKGVLYRPGLGGPRAVPKIAGLRSYTAGGDGAQPYWAAIDGDGNLHEYLAADWNHRFTDLDFDATVVALEPQASAALRATAAPGNPWSFGPAVLYVGGKGRLERRVVPLLQGVKR